MARLIFAEAVRNNTADDLIYYIGYYVVPVNPIKHRKPRMATASSFNTLDGPGGHQYGPYGNVVREYTWGNLPKEDVYKDMVTQLRTYKGKKRWMKEGSAGTDRKSVWHPVYIIDVVVEYEPAPSSRYYYKSVKLVYSILPLAQYSNWEFVASPDYPNLPQGGEEDEGAEEELPDP